MNSDNEVVLVQGRYYEPTEFDTNPSDEEINMENVVVGSNPDGKYDPDAYYKTIDEMIASGQLHTKGGILISKRVGHDFYDQWGGLIEDSK